MYDADFKDVQGQENIKRALEIAVAGGHNVIMIGPQILKTSEPRNYSELREAVCHALSAITLKDVHGWFTHGCYCDSPFVETHQSPVLTSVM